MEDIVELEAIKEDGKVISTCFSGGVENMDPTDPRIPCIPV